MTYIHVSSGGRRSFVPSRPQTKAERLAAAQARKDFTKTKTREDAFYRRFLSKAEEGT